MKKARENPYWYVVGCAYGFFLDVAKQSFASVQGIDVSEASASYARNNLGLDGSSGDFLPIRTGQPRVRSRVHMGHHRAFGASGLVRGEIGRAHEVGRADRPHNGGFRESERTAKTYQVAADATAVACALFLHRQHERDAQPLRLRHGLRAALRLLPQLTEHGLRGIRAETRRQTRARFVEPC